MNWAFSTPDGIVKASVHLEPLIADLRGQMDVLPLDWQRALQPDDMVMFADIEAGPLTDKHPDTGAPESRDMFKVAYGIVKKPDDAGGIILDVANEKSDLFMTATIIAPLTWLSWAAAEARSFPGDADAIRRQILADPAMLIDGQCVYYRPPAGQSEATSPRN